MVLTGMPEPLGATGLWSHQCRAGLLEQEEGAAGPDPGAASPSWVLGSHASPVLWLGAAPTAPPIPSGWIKGRNTKGVGWAVRGDAGMGRCWLGAMSVHPSQVPGMGPEGCPGWWSGPSGSCRCCA